MRMPLSIIVGVSRYEMERRCDGCGVFAHDTELRLFQNGWVVGALFCEDDATARGLDWNEGELKE